MTADRKTVSLPADLRDELASAGEERMLGVNKIAELAIRNFLDRLIPVDQLVPPPVHRTRADAEAWRESMARRRRRPGEARPAPDQHQTDTREERDDG